MGNDSIEQGILLIEHFKQVVVLEGLLDDVEDYVATQSDDGHAAFLKEHFDEPLQDPLVHQEVHVSERQQINDMQELVVEGTGPTPQAILDAQQKATVTNDYLSRNEGVRW